MAKKSLSIGFNKCELYFQENEEGMIEEVVVVERTKEEEKSYNFLDILKTLEGVEGLNIKISHDKELPSA